MQALDQTRDGMKIDQLNDSEHLPNIFLSFYNFYIGSVVDITNIYQCTKTFNLINTTIKNTTINMERIWRHPVSSQSEVVYTVAILKHKVTHLGACVASARGRADELSHSERACSVARRALTLLNAPLGNGKFCCTELWQRLTWSLGKFCGFA